MKTFNTLKRYLEEKLVIPGQGKRYGQVVFLAGGAGSGKDFAVANFIDSTDYKILDPDAVKEPYLKWNELQKKYPELRGRDQRNPEDADFVHRFLGNQVKLDDKILSSLFFSLMHKTDKTTLPNILFNRTFKTKADFERLIPSLISVGYKKEDMHLIWVLTNYKVAIQANLGRSRTVPTTVLIQTHGGAAQTMKSFLFDNYPSNLINGDAYVILGGEENTVFFKPPQGTSTTRQMVPGGEIIPKPRVVSKFQYVKVKDANHPFKPAVALSNIVLRWILQNSPDQEAIEKYLNQ